jgi:hypothetical protein
MVPLVHPLIKEIDSPRNYQLASPYKALVKSTQAGSLPYISWVSNHYWINWAERYFGNERFVFGKPLCYFGK